MGRGRGACLSSPTPTMAEMPRRARFDGGSYRISTGDEEIHIRIFALLLIFRALCDACVSVSVCMCDIILYFSFVKTLNARSYIENVFRKCY